MDLTKSSTAGLAIAALALGAPGAHAARLVAVRIAQHAQFARVVFESDAAAAFDVEKPDASGVRVHLEAACEPRTVATSRVPELNVVLARTADGACLAQVNTRGPVRIEAQALEQPPRLVLDLSAAARQEHETGPAATPGVAPAPEPPREAPQPPEEAPPVELVAPAITNPPNGAAPEAPAPTPNPVAAPEPPAAPAQEPAPAPEAPAATPPVAAAPPTPPVAAAPPPPPVAAAAPPRASSGNSFWDVRSVEVGAAIGAFVGLLAGAGLRRRGARPAGEAESPALAAEALPANATGPAAAPEPAEVIAAEPAEVMEPEPTAPASPAPAPDGALLGDLIAMFQRIDGRLASLEASLDAMREHAQQVAAREAAHGEELASQRVALARLQRTLRPERVRAAPAPARPLR